MLNVRRLQGARGDQGATIEYESPPTAVVGVVGSRPEVKASVLLAQLLQCVLLLVVVVVVLHAGRLFPPSQLRIAARTACGTRVITLKMAGGGTCENHS